MDATVLYSLGLDGGTVTTAMLATPTPYNTYLNTGLTPTPICTVSTIALNAVLHAPAGPVALLHRRRQGRRRGVRDDLRRAVDRTSSWRPRTAIG